VPLAQEEGIDLELKPSQGSPVQQYLDLLQSELGSSGLISSGETHVIRNDALVPAKTHPRELKVQPTLSETVEQRAFGELRQANLVDINQGANHQEDNEPD
jgi:hypothetical protein